MDFFGQIFQWIIIGAVAMFGSYFLFNYPGPTLIVLFVTLATLWVFWPTSNGKDGPPDPWG